MRSHSARVHAQGCLWMFLRRRRQYAKVNLVVSARANYAENNEHSLTLTVWLHNWQPVEGAHIHIKIPAPSYYRHIKFHPHIGELIVSALCAPPLSLCARAASRRRDETRRPPHHQKTPGALRNGRNKRLEMRRRGQPNRKIVFSTPHFHL